MNVHIVRINVYVYCMYIGGRGTLAVVKLIRQRCGAKRVKAKKVEKRDTRARDSTRVYDVRTV